MKDKNYLIYFMQTWGIILVVAGHSFYQTQDNSRIIDWIYSFHMPLFMFVSGYLLRYTTTAKHIQLNNIELWGRKGYLTLKAKRLLIPYIIISSMVYLPKVFLASVSVRPIECTPYSYIRMLIYPYTNVIGSFWFLPTIFLIFVAIMYGAKIMRQTNELLIIIALLIINIYLGLDQETVFNISGVFYYMLYIALGYYFCKYGIENKLKYYSLKIAIITFILSIVMVLYVPYFTGYDVITSVNGILMSIALGQLYINYGCRFFNHLYGATYTIYLLSWFPQVASQQFVLSIVQVPWYVTTTLALVSGIYVPLIIYKWIIKHKNSRPGHIMAFITGLS